MDPRAMKRDDEPSRARGESLVNTSTTTLGPGPTPSSQSRSQRRIRYPPNRTTRPQSADDRTRRRRETTRDSSDGIPSHRWSAGASDHPVCSRDGEPFRLTTLSREERDGRLAKLIRTLAQEPFDLSHGPLLRITLFRLSDVEHVLALVAHRIICDEASASLLLNELIRRYQTCVKGSRGQMGGLLSSIARLWPANLHHPQNRLSYWKLQLTGAPSSIDLSTDGNDHRYRRFEVLVRINADRGTHAEPTSGSSNKAQDDHAFHGVACRAECPSVQTQQTRRPSRWAPRLPTETAPNSQGS